MILGIDHSFSCTACIAGDGMGGASHGNQSTFSGGSISFGSPMDIRINRAGRLAVDVATWCSQFKPELIVIEAYAFASRTQFHHDIVEGGGILRNELHKVCRAKYLEIAPAKLKIWASGHGHAKKEFMADAIESRYGIRMLSHDLLDAWCLWKMGCQLLGRAKPNCAHEEKAIEGVLHPVIKEQTRRPRRPTKRGARQKGFGF